MLPYLIINGTSSRQITGLLIQSLPPITKPQIRTEKEEIDGRDGDIVTKLGYAAYDKTISIGLHGDYNVDDVISFFQTSGIIQFSNEIDKYYYFDTYDNIDFNRLIRFKTANVTLHVQPFKFSADETPIVRETESEENYITIRNIGNIYSRPTLKITGEGNIIITINDNQILSIDLPNTETTIIIKDMNAVNENGDYLNRLVTGNYDDAILKPGLNYLTVNGVVSKIEIEKYSRWI